MLQLLVPKTAQRKKDPCGLPSQLLASKPARRGLAEVLMLIIIIIILTIIIIIIIILLLLIIIIMIIVVIIITMMLIITIIIILVIIVVVTMIVTRAPAAVRPPGSVRAAPFGGEEIDLRNQHLYDQFTFNI